MQRTQPMNQYAPESTGHTEVVKIQFDSSILSLKELLKIFWECHDPTQGNRQGNDIGTQYRSACFCENDDDLEIAQKTFQQYQENLLNAGYGNITTEMKVLQEYYLQKNITNNILIKIQMVIAELVVLVALLSIHKKRGLHRPLLISGAVKNQSGLYIFRVTSM